LSVSKLEMARSIKIAVQVLSFTQLVTLAEQRVIQPPPIEWICATNSTNLEQISPTESTLSCPAVNNDGDFDVDLCYFLLPKVCYSAVRHADYHWF